MVLANILGGFIVIIVGTGLMPAVGDAVFSARFHNATTPTNVTGAAGTIVALSTLFFALGIMAAGVALAVNGFRESGMF